MEDSGCRTTEMATDSPSGPSSPDNNLKPKDDVLNLNSNNAMDPEESVSTPDPAESQPSTKNGTIQSDSETLNAPDEKKEDKSPENTGTPLPLENEGGKTGVEGPNQKEGKDRTGVVYLSRIPPFMGLSKLRTLFSKLGKIGRIYLHPEDPAEYNKRLKFGGNKRMKFSHGWVEFLEKSDAKRAALMLNNTQVNEKRFWKFDLWNVKYLPSFKWSNLVEYFSIKRDEKMELGHLIRNERRRNREYLEQLERENGSGTFKNKRKKRAMALNLESEPNTALRVKEDGMSERKGVSASLINSILA